MELSFGDGRRLRDVLLAAESLTAEELETLAADYAAERSSELRRPVAEDIRLGWEFGLFPSEVFALSGALQAAGRRAGLDADTVSRAWEAIADEAIARLLPSGLTRKARHELGIAWRRLLAEREANGRPVATGNQERALRMSHWVPEHRDPTDPAAWASAASRLKRLADPGNWPLTAQEHFVLSEFAYFWCGGGELDWESDVVPLLAGSRETPVKTAARLASHFERKLG